MEQDGGDQGSGGASEAGYGTAPPLFQATSLHHQQAFVEGLSHSTLCKVLCRMNMGKDNIIAYS